MTALGQYLRSKGMSQKAFAEVSGLPAPMVSQWISGCRRPGLKSALAIEAATGGVVPALYWAEFKTRRRKTAA